jgi:hypothetical protein
MWHSTNGWHGEDHQSIDPAIDPINDQSVGVFVVLWGRFLENAVQMGAQGVTLEGVTSCNIVFQAARDRLGMGGVSTDPMRRAERWVGA